MIRQLEGAGVTEWIGSERGDLVAGILAPNGRPEVSAVGLSLGSGFFGWEQDGVVATDHWSWCGQDGVLVVFNAGRRPLKREIKFQLRSVALQKVNVRVDGSDSVFPVNVSLPADVVLRDITWPPGRSLIDLHGDSPAVEAGNGDPRKIAFGVFNPEVGN